MSPGLLSPGLSSPGPLSRRGGRAQPHAELPEPPRAAGAPLISRWRQPGKGKGTAEQGVTPKAVTFAFFFPCFVSFWGSSPPHGSTPGASRPQKAQPEPAAAGTELGRVKPSTKPAELGGETLKSPTRGAAGGEAAARCVRKVAFAQLQWVWMGKLRQAAGEARRSSETRAALQPPASAEQAARGKLLGCGCSDTRQPAGTGSCWGRATSLCRGLRGTDPAAKPPARPSGHHPAQPTRGCPEPSSPTSAPQTLPFPTAPCPRAGAPMGTPRGRRARG